MIREEADEIIGMLIDLWPAAGWNETRRDAWRAVFTKYSRDHAAKVIGQHADRSKWPITVAEFRSLAARATMRDEGAPRGAPETPAARARRIYRVPSHVSDADVLKWVYRSESEKARLTYRKEYSTVVDGMRRNFRSDWRGSGLAASDGLLAECAVFGRTDEAELFWISARDA